MNKIVVITLISGLESQALRPMEIHAAKDVCERIEYFINISGLDLSITIDEIEE